MAEQFIIRIETDGGASSNSRASDFSGAALVGSTLINNNSKGFIVAPDSPLSNIKSAKNFLLEQAQAGLEGNAIGFSERYGFSPEDSRITNKLEFQKKKTDKFGTKKLELGTDYLSSGRGQQSAFNETHEAYYRTLGGKAADFLLANQQAITAGSVSLGFKLANSIVSHKQHRSGDSYYNDQLNNSMKFAGYATALGYGAIKGGPLGAGLVATGIAINETINLVTENANFNYDRMMDTLYVHNVKQVAGDISYGRNRRGDR